MKSKRPMLKLSKGELRWEQKEAIKEALKDFQELHLEQMARVEAAPMRFVKMAAYRANTQRVFALIHDDAQEVWVDFFSVSEDGKSFFAATNASSPLIGLVAQRPTYFISHRLAKISPKILYREFLRLRPKSKWADTTPENLAAGYELVCMTDSKWQEENLKGKDAEKVMNRIVRESYAAARELKQRDPAQELKMLLQGLKQPISGKIPSTLTAAAIEGNLEMVKLFLENGADIHEETGYSSPLGAAALGGHLNVVELLLKRGADPAHSEYPIFSAIAYAAGRGYGLIVKRLLQAGVPGDQRKAALDEANHKKHDAIARLLQGEKVSDAELSIAPKAEKISLKKEIDDTTLLMGREPEEETELRGPNAEKRALELLQTSEVKEKLDYRFREAGSYLDMAIATNNLKLAKAVLDLKPSKETLCNALFGAVERGNIELVDLLFKAGADAKYDGYAGYTPLITAAASGNPKMVKRLLDAGADPRAHSEGGETPMTAVNGPFEKEIRAMLEKAAPKPANVSAIKTQGKAVGDPSRAKGAAEFRKELYRGEPEWSVGCVEANCADVAKAFAKLHPKAKWHADAATKLLPSGKKPIFVFQLKGQKWTILARTLGWLQMDDLKELPKDAADLSQSLKSRALTYIAEDTSGCEGYELFENGKSIERADCMGEVQFKSSWRNEPDFGDHFPEPTFADLGIYLPGMWMDNDGYNSRLILLSIDASAVERLDFFELKP